MLGFETIGNATCIVHDDRPVLTTDPWLGQAAYYGSWAPDHLIPQAQRDSIRRAPFHWFSHGHPDHLHVASLPELSSACLLLSDHVGSRISDDLRAAGYKLRVLRDRRWVPLSRRVSVFSMANRNQDSVLLIRVGDQLVINANDSPDYGASHHTRLIARSFRHVYLLALQSWGAVDMSNVFNPDGQRLPGAGERRAPLGAEAQREAVRYGADRVIPCSSVHRYQRTDSAWAHDLVPSWSDYDNGALRNGPRVLPPFVRVDVATDTIECLDPAPCLLCLQPPEAFGDRWSDELEKDDRQALDAYFCAHAHLRRCFGFVAFRVGGHEHRVMLDPSQPDVGVVFEAPRASLMHAVRSRVFDDLLIGNFARVELHGIDALYPDFTPHVAKYGDGGRVHGRGELARYLARYWWRDPIGGTLHHFRTRSEQILRRWTAQRET